MSAQTGSSFFAPAERTLAQELSRQIDYFSETSLIRKILDAVPSPLLILNDHRQIVFAGKTLLELVDVEEEKLVHGLRPGDIFGCINAAENTGGCGTTEACSTCGAVLAILAGLKYKAAANECRLSRCSGGRIESFDLQVLAKPLACEGEDFVVLAFNDISHEKRRRALESIFFHDILNLLSSIRGFAELLQTYNPQDREKIFELIHNAAEQSIEEIQTQRIIAAAEGKDLKIKPDVTSVQGLLQQVVDIYSRQNIAEERRLVLDQTIPEVTFFTDRTLLTRVLGNMIKNALEASPSGETVTVGCRTHDNRVEFTVHNPGVMPHDVQLQIFQRSFSTKGAGRGLGTYSMRLLTEYLRGEVSFTSTNEKGTTFRASYPLTFPVN